MLPPRLSVRPTNELIALLVPAVESLPKLNDSPGFRQTAVARAENFHALRVKFPADHSSRFLHFGLLLSLFA